MLWETLLVIAFLLLFVEWYLKDDRLDSIPGPPGFVLFGNAFDFMLTPVKMFYHVVFLFNKYEHAFRLRVGPKKFVLLYEPEDVEIIISGNKNMTKGFLYTFLEPWLKQGLLLSHGQKWHQRRKILTPAFHFRILKHFSSRMQENADKLVQRLKPESEGNRPTDVMTFIVDFTLDSLCETAMGLDSETLNFKSYKEALENLAESIVKRLTKVWLFANYAFSWSALGRKQAESLRTLKAFREDVVNQRRDAKDFKNINFDNTDDDDEMLYGKKKLAMLDILLQAEADGKINADGIAEEVDTFIFAGHDTTARTLQFAFMLLASNPEWQDKIVDEIKQVTNGSNELTVNDLVHMKILESCIKETLRLYPPVLFFSRIMDSDTKLKYFTVPAGTDCTVIVYQLHRLRDQFVEPLAFKPDRFLIEPTWHPYSYIPFSAGPRNCIGQKFAMMEMKIAVSSVLRRYRLLPVTKPEDVIFSADLLIQPLHPILVKFQTRDSV